ncbi:ComEC/Rec2 family competence protein [Qingshengfaniella alkalisoli]|uniref:ComEC family competence protein n=1 Tax=Qingshengfaniella alkalisoli TaxID=2599296 RepID=A0A5B8J4P6_9RHOB|nr:ComEC/Rec2 family competence protein [Qingshengfaniella alkalisoli]QDY69250.1 ComEC family competence protein [Qingshengfaniella alkalisoli]
MKTWWQDHPELQLLQSISPVRTIALQRGRLLLWVPVFLATGIGLYFRLPNELAPAVLTFLALTAAALVLGARYADETTGPLLYALALVLVGVALTGARAHQVAGPVLGFRYFGPIEGRLIEIDRSGSDKLRITLDQVYLENTPISRIPDKVRVSLHGFVPVGVLQPGWRVATTGHLSAPEGPVEPGGFDFQRHAWFDRLGAVGYSRNPVVRIVPAEISWRIRVFGVRTALSAWVQSHLSGQTGAFAAAVLTGDRSSLDQKSTETMRATNLAHLLAISGLHMGLLTSVVFAALRTAIAILPPLALRVNAKKCAAVGAFFCASLYLLLSGGSIATQRAFIMVSVMLAAVLLDRKAITLRAVALAAIIVLVLFPETLLSPGFQMSFAATTALIWAFSGMKKIDRSHVPKWLWPVLTLVVTSVIAGLATAPIAAAHFNQMARYGLLANLLAVPVMGTIVMPAGLLAFLLAPLGLERWPFAIMGLGIDWIFFSASWVADWSGGVRKIVAPPANVLPLIGLGAVGVVISMGWLRLVGAIMLSVAASLWLGSQRPDMLISPSGGLVGLAGNEGRVLSKPRGDGFAASEWLENDGDAAGQREASARAKPKGRLFLGDIHVTVLTPGKARGLVECPEGLTISADVPDRQLDCPQLLAPDSFNATGALSVTKDGPGWIIRSSRIASGERLWNSKKLRLGVYPGPLSAPPEDALAALEVVYGVFEQIGQVSASNQ